VAQAAARDDGGDLRHRADLSDRQRSGQAPAGEDLAQVEVAGTLRLDARPARAADAGGVDDAHTLRSETPGGRARDAATDLLDHHRNVLVMEVADHGADLRQQG